MVFAIAEQLLPVEALPACPGRTVFEALVEGTTDREFIDWYKEGAHQRELARVARPPALHVTVVSPDEPPGEYVVDPETRTVTVTSTAEIPVVPSREELERADAAAVADDDLDEVGFVRILDGGGEGSR